MTDTNNNTSQNAGFGSRNQISEASVDVEREPMPDRAPETGSDKPKVPPARSGGAAEAKEKLSEGDPVANPVHHTGHVPPPVTADRE